MATSCHDVLQSTRLMTKRAQSMIKKDFGGFSCSILYQGIIIKTPLN